MAKILIERNFPIQSIKLLGTSANKGRKINFNDKIIYTKEAREGAFEGVDIAFFCVEAEISKILAPIAISEGAVIIDNSSAWRTEPDIPLIVPEVNSESLKNHKGLIANPNCSTIQMLVPLKPIHDKYKIKRIVVSTYQAVSGTGKNAIDELNTQAKAYVNEKEIANFVYPYQILFNAIPHIDSFIENATTVRIPVFRGHSESINIETELAFEIEDIKKLLKSSKGIAVIDDPKEYLYPMPLYATDTDDVYVGRIRKDFTVDNGLNMWVVADNLRKGAALNAVQIAETLIELKLL